MRGVRFTVLLTAGLIAVGSLSFGTGRAAAPAGSRESAPEGYAYALILGANGNWIGPTTGGRPDLSIFDALEAARPKFLRVSTHSGPRSTNSSPVPLPESPAVLERLVALRDSGTKLGVSVNAFYAHGARRGESKTVADVLDEGCAMLEGSEGLYEWVFLDFALSRTSKELRRLVSGLETGRRCGGLGWDHVVTNSTNWKNADSARLPPNASAHGGRLAVMNNGPEDSSNRWKERARLAAAGRYPAIGVNDRAFIEKVRTVSPASTPLLKLEVPHQTSNFASLSGRVQRSLLRQWASARDRLGFDLIFPLFVHKRSTANAYDSRVEETFQLQRRLLHDSP